MPALEGRCVVAVSLGSLYAGAVDKDGGLWMWGYGGHGNLGLGDRRSYNVRRPTSSSLRLSSFSTTALTPHSVPPHPPAHYGTQVPQSVPLPEGTDGSMRAAAVACCRGQLAPKGPLFYPAKHSAKQLQKTDGMEGSAVNMWCV